MNRFTALLISVFVAPLILAMAWGIAHESLLFQAWWRWFGSGYVAAEASVTGSHCYVGETPTVSYTFSVDGGLFEGRGQAKPVKEEGISYQTPSTVRVYYKPSAPSHSYTEYQSFVNRYLETPFMLLGCLGLLCAAVGMFFYYFFVGFIGGGADPW